MTDADWLLCGGSMDSAAAHLPPDRVRPGLSGPLAGIEWEPPGEGVFRVDVEKRTRWPFGYVEVVRRVELTPGAMTAAEVAVLASGLTPTGVKPPAYEDSLLAEVHAEWASRLAVLDREGTP